MARQPWCTGSRKARRPEQQGLAAMMEVFIISFITSSISALGDLVTGTWNSGASRPGRGRPGVQLAMPSLAAGWMLAVSVFCSGTVPSSAGPTMARSFSSTCLARVIMPYRWLYCLLIPFGAVAKVDLVWAWGDILNGLQVFPNVIGLIFLSGIVPQRMVQRKPRGIRVLRDICQYGLPTIGYWMCQVRRRTRHTLCRRVLIC